VRARAIFGVALAFGMTAAGAWSGAMAQAGSWTVAAAPNGVFTVETPCGASEVAAMQRQPANLVNVELVPASRVVCAKEPMIFVAGELVVPELPPGTSVFDFIVQQASASRDVDGHPVQTNIRGRRAFVNREERNGVVAQTGFVEISRGRLIMLLAGFRDGRLGVAAQDLAIQRFYNSISVNSQ
jgi:hypothetical protein